MNKKMFLGIGIAFLVGVFGVLWWQGQGSVEEEKGMEEIVEVVATTEEEIVVDTEMKEEVIVTDSPTIEPTATLAATVTPDPYGNWTQYTNNNDKYRFKHDPGWNLSTQANTVTVQGDVSTKGWPSINVSRLVIVASNIAELRTEVEGLGSGAVSETAFGVSSIPAVLNERTASPQAYAGKEYYFLHQGNVLLVSLNDTGHTEGDVLYQEFLDNFELY